jgi:hypothetical protein
VIPRVVRQGEYLAQIAHVCGVDADAVWNHPKNDALRKLRKDPHMLCAGDVIYLPERESTWLPVAVGSVNKFSANVPGLPLTLNLVGRDGPLKNVSCRIGGVPGLTTATTDGNSALLLHVPFGVQSVVIDVDEPRFHAVARVGHLDPPDTPSGIRMRLRNLHFLHDHEVPGETLATVIASFQRSRGLPGTGAVDTATEQALVAAHGC